MPELTIETFLSELARLESSVADDGVYTLPELSRMHGRGEQSMRRVVKEAIASGKMVPARTARVTMNGVRTTVWGYRLA